MAPKRKADTMDEPIDLTGSDDEQAAQRSTNDTTYGSGDESDRPKKKLKRSRGESPEVPDSEASFKAESKPVVETKPATPPPAHIPSDTANATDNTTSISANEITNSATNAAATLPTPDQTPEKPSGLSHLPELAERYLPMHLTEQGVDFVNPKKFCTKPAFWHQWPAKRYWQLAQELRNQFDPIPFARQFDIPVEEVQAHFTAVVVNPLYDAMEARRRGDEGIKELMKLYNKYGTQTRTWKAIKDKSQGVRGELSAVKPGVVEVIDPEGSKVVIQAKNLTADDTKYLKPLLNDDELEMLGMMNKRTWCFFEGKSDGLRAEFLTIKTGLIVVTVDAESRQVEIPVDKLSTSDKAYLRARLSDFGVKAAGLDLEEVNAAAAAMAKPT